MINPNQPILTLPLPWEMAIPLVADRLRRSGLSVMRTFDLRQARGAEAGCTCSYHGTEQCDCQLVVLLVYGKEAQPVTIVAHSHNGQTWFSLVEFLGASNTRLEAHIRSCLAHDLQEAPDGDRPAAEA